MAFFVGDVGVLEDDSDEEIVVELVDDLLPFVEDFGAVLFEGFGNVEDSDGGRNWDEFQLPS